MLTAAALAVRDGRPDGAELLSRRRISKPLHVPFDALLDLHVRDGLVYYRALQANRGRLSRYIASLNSPSVVSGYAKWSDDQKKAFWLNAYNALVMQTVINHYPIRGTAKELSAEQHQADSRRVRKDGARDCRKAAHARSDRDHRARGARRSACLPRARARSGRQRAPAQRGIRRKGGRQAARRRRRHSSR